MSLLQRLAAVIVGLVSSHLQFSITNSSELGSCLSLFNVFCLSTAATKNSDNNKGRVIRQDNSGTAGVEVGVGVTEGGAIGEDEMSVDVEPSVKAIV